MKNIAILGSTGNVGIQALDVIRRNPEKFRVSALCCNRNIDLLEEQIREFSVTHAAVFDPEKAKELRTRVDADILSGMEGIRELTSISSVDLVINSLVGSIGIQPTISAIKNGKDVALANKETLVAAGDIVMGLIAEKGTLLYPVDSEHSAIFQCIHGEERSDIARLILTCSGGAFRERDADELESLTAKEALEHPTWSMGKKITVDSATLMNKGFEVIEARMLFGVNYDNIDVVIHPESIIHSLVEFVDNSVLAQLSYPDMRLPIQYALTYPARSGNALRPLDLAGIAALSFDRPDTGRFPCLAYAYEAGRIGGTMPCLLNAVNEVAVAAFLAGKISFMDIPRLIRKKMDNHRPVLYPDIETILDLDTRTKQETAEELGLGEK